MSDATDTDPDADRRMDESPVLVDQTKPRLVLEPSVPNSRPSEFVHAVTRLLNALQDDDAISFTTTHYSCNLCSESFPRIAALSQHCWEAHRHVIPSAVRPAVLFLFPDLPPAFDDAQFRDACPIPLDFFTVPPTEAPRITCRTPCAVFPLVLGLLAPDFAKILSEFSLDKRPIVLNLPGPCPALVSCSAGGFDLSFGDLPNEQAESVAGRYENVVAKILSENVLVAKFINVSPSAVADGVLSRLRRKFTAVFVKTRASYDGVLGACDVTVTALLPRWERAVVDAIRQEFQAIRESGRVLLCQECNAFFPAAMAESLGCARGTAHSPADEEFTALAVYRRPFTRQKRTHREAEPFG
jgi:hypothetical protein